MNASADHEVDAHLRRAMDRIPAASLSGGLDLAEVSQRVQRRRALRRTATATAVFLLITGAAVVLTRPSSERALDTVGPAASAPPTSAMNAPGTSSAAAVTTTVAGTGGATPGATTMPGANATPSVPGPTAPTVTSAAVTTTTPPVATTSPAKPAAPLVLGLDGLGAVRFGQDQGSALATLRSMLGHEGYDSAWVGGCRPTDQNRWVRFGRLMVGFTMTDRGPEMSAWQYPAQSSVIVDDVPPTVGGPVLTTAGGFAPEGPAQERSALLATIQQELPQVTDAAPSGITAMAGEDVIRFVLSPDDGSPLTVSYMQGEHTTLFNSMC